jgi:hypothetical protein
MSARTFATLDPNRIDGSLSLSQGNCVVTTNAIVDYNRKALGTLAFGAGTIAFECYFWSTSRPNSGLLNLCSVGVASTACPLNLYVGGDTSTASVVSCGLRPSDGSGGATGAGIYSNGALQGSAFNQVAERSCIGVMLVNDPTTPIVSFHVNGNNVGQFTLTAGLFYVPAVSIGSASVGDVSAYLNFGQYALDYPLMQVTK